MNKMRRTMKEMRRRFAGSSNIMTPAPGAEWGWYEPSLPSEKQIRSAIRRKNKKDSMGDPSKGRSKRKYLTESYNRGE